jgi:hypothetical protein
MTTPWIIFSTGDGVMPDARIVGSHVCLCEGKSPSDDDLALAYRRLLSAGRGNVYMAPLHGMVQVGRVEQRTVYEAAPIPAPIPDPPKKDRA